VPTWVIGGDPVDDGFHHGAPIAAA
jgi:hypothetical protein